jgi:hypothetical protein
MKRSILFVIILAMISSSAISQGKRYHKRMKSAIEDVYTITDTSELVILVAKFELIAYDYPTTWLPLYYGSQILTTISFAEKVPEVKDAHLERAQIFLDSAMVKVPDESELYVIQALIKASKIMVDPKLRAIKHYSQMRSALNKAEDLNPENPRVYLVDGLAKTVLPKFLGGGEVAAKEMLLFAEEKFANYENEGPLWPDWGKKALIYRLEQLKDVEVPIEE